MRRALLGTVGIMLAIAIVVPTPLVSAQFLARFRRQQAPVRTDRYGSGTLLSTEHQRLAEMKVELALLGDIATFPYDFSARASGDTVELRGHVPNDMIRQRAMELARHSTFRRVIDGLRIQPNLSVRSILRPPPVVQREGIELLQGELGEPAKQMSLEARPNGVVVLTGRIDSVESKLEISRLFRRLSGCSAVINELTIETTLLDGQRMARVTRNGLLIVSPSALWQELGPQSTSPPALVPEKEAPRPADQQPAVPVPELTEVSSLNAHEGELSLPVSLDQKQQSKQAKLPVEKIGSDWEAFAPSKFPVKWGHPAASWEAQAKELEAAYLLPKPAAPQTAQQQVPRTPQPARQQDNMPTPIRMVGQSADTKKPQLPTATNKPNRKRDGSRFNFAETRKGPETTMTWRRPGGSEESEAKVTPSAEGPPTVARDRDNPTPSVSSLRSPRRWPPAYVTGPPPGQGRRGIIAFEDAPKPPASNTKPTVIAMTRPVVPAELQRKIKSLCGRQARDVVAAVQRDGSVLVRVKVANRFIEDQLSRKILALPEMTSPRVRLMMEIEP